MHHYNFLMNRLNSLLKNGHDEMMETKKESSVACWERNKSWWC